MYCFLILVEDSKAKIEEAHKIIESDILKVIKDCVNSKRLLVKEGSRTASLWLQYMRMVDILHQFIKAERIGNWELHLQTVKEMLPYLAAAGHNLYVKSARMYLQTMADLPNQHPDVYQELKKY